MRVKYQGDGENKTFTFPYKINSADEIKVLIAKDGTITEHTDFTLKANTEYPSLGGTVTYPSSGDAAGADTTVIIERSMPILQNDTYKHGDMLDLDNIEKSLDTVVMQQQQLLDLGSRSIKIGEDKDHADVDLRIPAPRPGYGWQWNKDGTALEEIPLGNVGELATNAKDYMDRAENAANKSEDKADSAEQSAQNARDWAATVNIPKIGTGKIGQYMRVDKDGNWYLSVDWINVKDFGAIGDGIIDDTRAVQEAIQYAVQNSKGVKFPAGTYLITDMLIIDGFVRISGNGINNTTILFNNNETNVTGSAVKSLFIIGFSNPDSVNYNLMKNLFIGNFTIKSGSIVPGQNGIVFNSISVIYHHIENIKCVGFTGAFVHYIHDGNRKNTQVYAHNPMYKSIYLENTSAFLTQKKINNPGTIYIYGGILADIHVEGNSSFNNEKALFYMEGFRNVQYENIIVEGHLQTPPECIFYIENTNTFTNLYFEFKTDGPKKCYFECYKYAAVITLHNLVGIPSNSPFVFVDDGVTVNITNSIALRLKGIKTDDSLGTVFLHNCSGGSYFDGNELNNTFLSLIDSQRIKSENYRLDTQKCITTMTNKILFEYPVGCPIESDYNKMGVYYFNPSGREKPTIEAYMDSNEGRIVKVTPNGTEKGIFWGLELKLPNIFIGSQITVYAKYKMSADKFGSLKKTIGIGTARMLYDEESTELSENKWTEIIGTFIYDKIVAIRFDYPGNIDYTNLTPHTLYLKNLRIMVGNESDIVPNTKLKTENIKFKASNIPTHGDYIKGDIIYNSNPIKGGALGWVCISDGNPGEWLGFGTIGGV